MAAVAEHRRAVGKRLDLVHAVRDVEDRDVLRLQTRQQGVDLLHVGARQSGGRLVEDQKPRLLSKGLGDFHHLPARQRQVAHPQQRIDVLATDLGQQRLGAAALRARVDQAEAPSAAR